MILLLLFENKFNNDRRLRVRKVGSQCCHLISIGFRSSILTDVLVMERLFTKLVLTNY